MRNYIFIIASASLLASTVTFAQTSDESKVILPLEAQTCNLPSAPGKIPAEATYDDLATAKGNVVSFQSSMMAYRECLESATSANTLTEGNHLALTNAYNYSVEMEERIAEQFNVAVRAYKARQAGQAEK